MKTLRVAMAQLNHHIGDIHYNLQQHIDAALHARDVLHADVIVFSESSLTGYPVEDLLLRPSFIEASAIALKTLAASVSGIYCVVGHPHSVNHTLYNAASVLFNGENLGTYHKRRLPNYGVFDEVRYYSPGNQVLVLPIKGVPVGIVICEDGWYPEPIAESVAQGAALILSPNASPFELDKHEQRLTVLRKRASHNHVPVVYVNCIGGQDELVFDGGSMVLDADGNIATLAPFFKEAITVTEMHFNEQTTLVAETPASLPSKEARAYDAITLAIHDYVEKNHVSHVLLGLSGGIDSALTLALAVDALGADRVHAVILPSRYSSALSLEEANTIASNFKVKTTTIDIEPTTQAVLKTLADKLDPEGTGITQQNIQARARGLILMALSNETGGMVLTTGNRSEIAVGYCTLYGDMVGGFAPLKDVPKTMVYALAAYRNTLSPVIPERTITREPTAELAPNQKDQDALPPYDVLDAILYAHLNQGMSEKDIIAAGFPANDVRRVLTLVKRNEYKRKQSVIGPRINHRSFGKDWRFPVTNGFNG